MNRKTTKRQVLQKTALSLSFAVFLLLLPTPVFASAESIISSGFNSLMDIVKAIVTAIGTILLLWGLFEWGTAMQSPDGVQQSNAFKRIGGGLVMILAPQLVTLLTSSI